MRLFIVGHCRLDGRARHNIAQGTALVTADCVCSVDLVQLTMACEACDGLYLQTCA